MTSRRNFLRSGLAVAVAGAVSGTLQAEAKRLHLPLGLQLYSVRTLLPAKYDETLNMIAGIGYRDVEGAGYYNYSVSDVKRAMAEAGLNLVGSHYGYGKLSENFDEILAFNKELGVKYIICASQAHRHPALPANQDIYSLDDWRFTADQLNAFGEKVHAAGLGFGYHNHFRDFTLTDGVIPYNELMHRTDPALVTMEMDLGWVIGAGANPIEYLHEYSSRITMLHVKDFVKPAANPDTLIDTELGRGFIDYRPIFRAAAKAGNIKHVFVEQEAYDIPVKDSLTVDAQYMRRLTA